MIRLWYQHGRGHVIGIQEDKQERFFCHKFQMDSVDIRIAKNNAIVQAEDGIYHKRTLLEITNYGQRDPKKYAYDIIKPGVDDPAE